MSLEKLTSTINSQVAALPDTISPVPTVIFTDVDDTLTFNGMLPIETYTALFHLKEAGITVIPVTGASAGWCDCLIKTWPIQHIIGENGALYMEKNNSGIVSTLFEKNSQSAKADMQRLQSVGSSLTERFPTIKFTQDHPFRITDVAFDIGQTISVAEPLAIEATQWLIAQGIQARRSSIHINAWLGNHSKSTGALAWLDRHKQDINTSLFIGDSPNDESMFETFPLSVGVANIERFINAMDFLPTYITEHQGGYGFVDMANTLLKSQSEPSE